MLASPATIRRPLNVALAREQLALATADSALILPSRGDLQDMMCSDLAILRTSLGATARAACYRLSAWYNIQTFEVHEQPAGMHT